MLTSTSAVVGTLIIVATLVASTVKATAGFETLQLCQVSRGFAGSDNYQYNVDVQSSAFAVRGGEAILFVLRTPAEDDTIPAATINAVYTTQGGSTSISSDTTTGVLQLGESVGTLQSLKLTVVNTAPAVETPFVLYSYHANFPSCAVPVSPGKLMSLPLTTQLAESPSPAVAYFELSHPVGLRHYTLTVLEGAASVTFSTSTALTTDAWVPAPNTGVSGDLPGDPTPAVAQPLYLKVVPSVVASPPLQTLRFQVVWTSTAATPPAGSNNGGTGVIGTGVPGIVAPLPGSTPETPVPTTADEASTGGSVLWSMFVFFIVVGIIYFVARTAYNVSQGEREFPRMVPHHEAIGQGIAAITGCINAAAGKANIKAPFQGGQGSGYDDVEDQEGGNQNNYAGSS